MRSLRKLRHWYIEWRYGSPPDCSRCDRQAVFVEKTPADERPVCLTHAAHTGLSRGLMVLRDLDPKEDYE